MRGNSDIRAVRWINNRVVTVVSSHLKHESYQSPKRYRRVKKAWTDVALPHLIEKCNSGRGADQLVGYLNNLRLYIYTMLLSPAFWERNVSN